jgi:hypothetical protein
MTDFYQTFFSPLDKSACDYFYFLTFFSFGILFVILVIEIVYIYKNYKNINFRILSHSLFLFLNVFISYFVNRLMYSICINSLV